MCIDAGTCATSVNQHRFIHLAENNNREYAATGFRSRPPLQLPSMGGEAVTMSPAGTGRQRRGHHVPHEYVGNQ